MSYDVIENDPLMNNHAKWSQVKTHKDKIVMLPAGANRLVCVLNALACAHAAGCFKAQMYDPHGMNYLFPELFAINNPATAITG